MLKIKIFLSVLAFAFALSSSVAGNALKSLVAKKTVVHAVQEIAGIRFKGQVAKSRFEMILWREADNLRGNYYYLKSGSDNSLDLRGKIGADGTFTMQEFDRAGKQTGEFTGFWKEDSDQAGIKLEGEWKKTTATETISFAASEQVIAFTNNAKILTVTFSKILKARRFEVTAAYPEITNGTANVTGFNQLVRARVIKETDDFTKLVQAQTAADLKFLPEGINYYLDIGFNVEYADNDLISLNFSNSTYTGGAHPNSSFFTLNYDLKNGRELKLADLFKSGTNYLQLLSAYSIKELQSRTDKGENLGLAQDLWKDGAKPVAANFKSWNLTRKGLIISFNPYQVGPYAVGPQFVFVPYAKLKDNLKMNGALAKMLEQN